MTYTKTPLSYRLFLSQINDQNRFITLDLESSKLQLLPETFPIPPEMGRITYGWRLYKDTFAHFTEGSTRDQSPKTAFLQVANGRTITKFDAFLSSPADNTHRNSRLEAGFFRKPDTNEQVSWYAVDLHHNKAATYNLPDLTQAGLSWSNLYLVLSTKPRNQDDTNLQIYRPIPQ